MTSTGILAKDEGAASGSPSAAGGTAGAAGAIHGGGGTAGAAAGTGVATGTLRVAVLDRDSGFIQVLSKRMERLGWEQRALASPVTPDAIAAMRLSALVVDLAVLGPQAWEWLQRLCSALPELGVIVCTGPSTVAQRVRGLRTGADDWVSKPCHPEEVIARVEGLARRRRGRGTARAERKTVSAGEVEIRTDRFQAYVQDQSLELTRREFELIELLAGAEGRVLEREEIYSRLWGYSMVRGDRSVDVFVRKLRQKLEKASPDWRYIHTHFGIGYRFAAEPLDGADPELAARALEARGIAQPGHDGAEAVCEDEWDERDSRQPDEDPVQAVIA